MLLVSVWHSHGLRGFNNSSKETAFSHFASIKHGQSLQSQDKCPPQATSGWLLKATIEQKYEKYVWILSPKTEQSHGERQGMIKLELRN